MDDRNELEIYIPVEAEVKSIPLQSLPSSVLRRMGLPLSDSDAPRKSADSQQVIWICPTVIGRKGQGSASRRGSAAAENARSLLGTKFRDRPDSLQMSFVSSNRAAWEVLKGISPGKRTSNTQPFPQGSVTPSNQNAVVIYCGRVYLCIRSRGQKKPASSSTVPSTSKLASESPKKGLLHDSRPGVERATCKAKHRQKKDVMLKRKSAKVSVKAGNSSPRPSDAEHKEDNQCATAAGREHTSEEAALQPQEEQKAVDGGVGGEHEMQDVDTEEAASARNDDQSSSHMWTMSESLGPATASTSLQMGFDFNELEQEEKIAQMKARFMQSEAALKNMLS
ncbi:uncharacterized protein si:dkeyp-110g5.4 [Melanotaenia boesemani]|uniref:uncharacterized protein si:dkeyp-110g5.4 n=1 Tax=Melanotaenia boesemani TaxID=1250792 RepID=UPI001C03B2CD|nr:uncharacterized protein si:dkeyp-110g5.4 [Melanotaenia boesemani]